jgi:hypothetical protein
MGSLFACYIELGIDVDPTMLLRGGVVIGQIQHLWALIQGDPVFMRKVNGWLTIFWIVMIPISILTGWISSVAYVSALSLWALVAGHWSSWQAARVEVQQQREQQEREENPPEKKVVKELVEQTTIEKTTSADGETITSEEEQTISSSEEETVSTEYEPDDDERFTGGP